MSEKRGKFTPINVVKFSELLDGKIELPESDLCFQNNEGIVQFKYEDNGEEAPKYEIKPGAYSLVATNQGVKLNKIDLRVRELLTSATNTTLITNEAKTFFSKLHVYEKLRRAKKRSILLYSDPGMGKSSSIIQFSSDAMKEEPGTVVINWPTSEVESGDVSRFLSSQSEYTPECTRLILIIEDIGGNEREGYSGPRGIDSSMLNLLDGVDVTFRLPTFILATTNYPQNLLSALADRPGRFDLMLELKAPKLDEKIKLMEFIAQRELDSEEKMALNMKGAEQFSIAHLEEVIVRSLLHDKTIPQVIKELVEHKKRFSNAFEEKGSVGFGGRDD
jgi:AAA+ superfamily predicted ATPase